MKAFEIPQDNDQNYEGLRKLRYGRSENGDVVGYTSNGDSVEREVMDVAWQSIEKKIEATYRKVVSGELSPLAYYLELYLLEPKNLASNVGLWTWQVRQHLRPKKFSTMPEKTLKKYADFFNISLETLRATPKRDTI
ncbi:MAG: hypothetical protein AB7T49_10620 [Oligoflexales bacterium]